MDTHYQNYIVEIYIQKITKDTKTLLLHTKRHWSDTIVIILLPFALKVAEDRRKHLKLDNKGLILVHKFSKTYTNFDIRSWHTWDCPVFLLDRRVQGGYVLKWYSKTCVEICLGYSLFHTGSVALILNPSSFHVSSQFHVVCDETFSTVLFMKNEEIPLHWKDLVTNHM